MNVPEQIAKILSGACPAFVRDKEEGGTTWHHCRCKARPALAFCECVWHQTDTCIAGKWPQLSFLTEMYKQNEEDAAKWLERVKQVITKGEIE